MSTSPPSTTNNSGSSPVAQRRPLPTVSITEEPIPLHSRFAKIKRDLIASNEAAVSRSWTRLLHRLRSEIDRVSKDGPGAIPTIDFADLPPSDSTVSSTLSSTTTSGKCGSGHSTTPALEYFIRAFRQCGVAVIRNVIPRETTEAWQRETSDYLASDPEVLVHQLSSHETPPPTPHGNVGYEQGYEQGLQQQLFWSPAQIQARVHPNLLGAQRFAMQTIWHAGTSASNQPPPPLCAALPVVYADRMVAKPSPAITTASTTTAAAVTATPTTAVKTLARASVDGGSVERWESAGYGGRSGVYGPIFAGEWESYDPWDSNLRQLVVPDLYRGAGSCGMFRLFQGWLCLSDVHPPLAPLQVSHLLQLTTAYLLLRPYFSPLTTTGPTYQEEEEKEEEEQVESRRLFLGPDNWALNPPDHGEDAVLHGALPGYAQELSAVLHPHLFPYSSSSPSSTSTNDSPGRGKSVLVDLPPLRAGDYVLWHPDMVHSVTEPLPSPASDPPSSPPHTYMYPPPPNTQTSSMRSSSSSTASSPPTTTPQPVQGLYIPACPLTQANALFLIRQRRAFLLGQPGPDFVTLSGAQRGPPASSRYYSGGEGEFASRPGVQDVADAGGEEGLRAMGMLPWEEEKAAVEGGGDDYEDEDGDIEDDLNLEDYIKEENIEGEEEGEEKGHLFGETKDGRVHGSAAAYHHRPRRLNEVEKTVVRISNALLFPDRFSLP